MKKTPAPSGTRFGQFYTHTLAVWAFWAVALVALVAVYLAAAQTPKVFATQLIGIVGIVLVVRVLCECAAVLFQIHDRLEELCQYQRDAKAEARKQADLARIEANKARQSPTVA